MAEPERKKRGSYKGYMKKGTNFGIYPSSTLWDKQNRTKKRKRGKIPQVKLVTYPI